MESKNICYSGENYSEEDFTSIINSLHSNPEKYKNVTKDGGVRKRIIKQGCGDIVKPGASVEVHYSAYHSESQIPFDSTRLRCRTFTVDVPENIEDVVHTAMSGIEIGITTMKLFEESLFILQPKYAMGALGCYPRVPPNATCFVTITIISIGNYSHAQEYENLPMSEKRYADYEVFESGMLRRKHQAKQVFNSKNYQKAVEIYKKALNLAEMYSAKDEYYDVKRNKIIVDIENNLSLCYILMNLPAKALQHADYVLNISKTNVKALFYKAKASRLSGNLMVAEEELKKAKKLAPNNVSIEEEFIKLERDLEISNQSSKQNYLFAFARRDLMKKEPGDKRELNYRHLISSSVADLIETTIQRFIKDDNIKTFAFTSDYFDENELSFCRQLVDNDSTIDWKNIEDEESAITIVHIFK